MRLRVVGLQMAAFSSLRITGFEFRVLGFKVLHVFLLSSL